MKKEENRASRTILLVELFQKEAQDGIDKDFKLLVLNLRQLLDECGRCSLALTTEELRRK